MKFTTNPETKRIHVNPKPECNVQNARSDPGAKPENVTPRQAARLIRHSGYNFCGVCTA